MISPERKQELKKDHVLLALASSIVEARENLYDAMDAFEARVRELEGTPIELALESRLESLMSGEDGVLDMLNSILK